ncbi:hypothetical protein CLV28_2990 [Sediminihabitans luteus]|uniref:Uncharacterized protein n=1 Tax=Sediminihabitans luteus TaxID=1138585 RepID=A0A2M9CBX5_9CELL|nr:hypothetical protein [Sediminihabitans luteus]PJJ68574.1 hypothetical protein CLV28_2990 [Sediminihabitans luteus]GII99912.1 hypothetical protein Slu03_22900 [Sediminihabitans luteus]
MTRSSKIVWYAAFVVVIALGLAWWAVSTERTRDADRADAQVACTQDIQRSAGESQAVVTSFVSELDGGTLEFEGSEPLGDDRWTCLARRTTDGWVTSTSQR